MPNKTSTNNQWQNTINEHTLNIYAEQELDESTSIISGQR